MIRFNHTFPAILIKPNRASDDIECYIASLDFDINAFDTNPRNPNNATINFNYFKLLTPESYTSVEEAIMMSQIAGYFPDESQTPVIFLTSILHDCPRSTHLHPIDSTHSKATLDKYIKTIDINHAF